MRYFLLMTVITLAVQFSTPPPTSAQTGSAIRNNIATSMDVEKQTQRDKTQWLMESQRLSNEIKALELRRAALEKRIAKQKKQLGLARVENTETRRKLREAKRVKEELNSFLDSVLVRIKEQIHRDLPFLEQERAGRLLALEEMMLDPDESAAERFRRVFEALQIETEYGTTVEVTQETISLSNTLVLADIFRLGRVSLFCQTPDQKRSGIFDPASREWQVLPESVNDNLSRAIAMARLERSVELVKLPLGRILVQ